MQGPIYWIYLWNISDFNIYNNKMNSLSQLASSPTRKPKTPASENLANRYPCSTESQRHYQLQYQKLQKNKQKLTELQQRISYLKQQRAKKVHELDTLDLSLKEIREHKEVLPLIKQLRQHYKKLKQQLGSQLESEFEDDDVDVDEMSYEQLLELGEKIGKVSKGLTQGQFEKLDRVVCQAEDTCSICQDVIVCGTRCVRLRCGHFYDEECLKGWFQMEKVCPLCKSECI